MAVGQDGVRFLHSLWLYYTIFGFLCKQKKRDKKRGTEISMYVLKKSANYTELLRFLLLCYILEYPLHVP